MYVCGEGDPNPLPADPADVAGAKAKWNMLKDNAAAACPTLKDSEVVAKQACYLPCRLRHFIKQKLPT